MIVTTSWIEQNYNKFNELYWGGLLPSIEFRISRAKHTWGFAGFKYDFYNDTIIPEFISISNYYDSPENVKINTLLHEMIHIADYFWHPEHYIQQGRKLTKREYDPHGYWFKNEAQRISKESGYEISVRVTSEEMEVSSLSENSVSLQKHKINNARIIVVTSNAGSVWYIKTDKYNLQKTKSLIKRYLSWYSWVKVYTITDQYMSNKRNATSRLRGWSTNKISMRQKLMSWGATEIESYKL